MFADFGAPIQYYQCNFCRFLFSSAFRDWTDDDFRDHVYNEHYILTDPLFECERPRANAALLNNLFLRERDTVHFLDFGGGRGLAAQHLRDMGYSATSYDKYHEANPQALTRTYGVVSAFEVIEHVPYQSQNAWMSQLSELLADSPYSRIVLSSELVRPSREFEWWYVSPRNGHISVHSDDSLKILAGRFGLSVTSISSSVHLLQREGRLVSRAAANDRSALKAS